MKKEAELEQFKNLKTKEEKIKSLQEKFKEKEDMKKLEMK